MVGSIPACAGEPSRWRTTVRLPSLRVYPRVCGGASTSYEILPSSRCEVYPRVCGGARSTPSVMVKWHQGLSPRVRGSLAFTVAPLIAAMAGSIPACAGEPTSLRSAVSATRVYPRVCGGAISRTCMGHSSRGLSPRVRGSLDALKLPRVTSESRSIPACAGEPSDSTGASPCSLQRVYPRVCGGATLKTKVALSVNCKGLSPRVRGSPCERHVAVAIASR